MNKRARQLMIGAVAALAVFAWAAPTLKEENEGLLHGYTDNYVRVSLPFDASLINRVLPMELGPIDGNGHAQGTLQERYITAGNGPLTSAI